jgi:hypothetical protein
VNKKFALILTGIAGAAVILHFLQFFPIATYYSRLFVRQLDITVPRICLFTIAALLCGAFAVHKVDRNILQPEQPADGARLPQRLIRRALQSAVLISSILLVTAASNALHRRSIVSYFNTHAIKADYSETGKLRIEFKGPSALDETLEKIALLSKIESVDDLNFFGDRIRVIPAALGDIADLDRLSIACDPVETLPDTIGNISRLRSLALYLPKLHKLPPGISRLKNLESLGMYKMKSLEKLPDDWGQMKSLALQNPRFQVI